MSPKKELRARILAKVARPLGGAGPTAEEIADAVMELFYTVEDDWERVEVTTISTDGQSWLDNRFLVARAPVQGQRYDRIADRTAQ